METYYIGGYWGARRETAADCARRAERFFEQLVRCDPAFGAWFRAGRAPEDSPGAPVRSESLEEWERLMLGGRHWTRGRKKVIEELGFGFTLWTPGAARRHTLVSLQCGGDSPSVSNACVLQLPSEGDVAARLLEAPVLARVLTCLATSWEPDFGIAHSHAVRDLVPQEEPGEIDVGWVTYLSHRQGALPPLPAPVRMEPVGTLGTLITLTPERFTAFNPEHVALAQRVRELLKHAGVLSPV